MFSTQSRRRDAREPRPPLEILVTSQVATSFNHRRKNSGLIPFSSQYKIASVRSIPKRDFPV